MQRRDIAISDCINAEPWRDLEALSPGPLRRGLEHDRGKGKMDLPKTSGAKTLQFEATAPRATGHGPVAMQRAKTGIGIQARIGI
jgi:hypothetical protein